METKIQIDFTNSYSNMGGVLDRKQTGDRSLLTETLVLSLCDLGQKFLIPLCKKHSNYLLQRIVLG